MTTTLCKCHGELIGWRSVVMQGREHSISASLQTSRWCHFRVLFCSSIPGLTFQLIIQQMLFIECSSGESEAFHVHIQLLSSPSKKPCSFTHRDFLCSVVGVIMYLMWLQTCLWSRFTSKDFHLQNKKPEGFYWEAASEKNGQKFKPFSHVEYVNIWASSIC